MTLHRFFFSVFCILLLSSCLHRKSIQDEQPFYTTSPDHDLIVSRREVCMQEGGKWQNGSCSKEFSYLIYDQICLERSKDLVWDGDKCIDRATQPNFYRYCKESTDIEIRKFVNVIRFVFGERSCEGAYTKLKISKDLNLEFRLLTNLEPLKNMTHIEILNLKGNRINDLSFLNEMVNLKHLNLDENEISDISDIANLRNLEYLSLKNNAVYDLSPLRDLEKLKNIEIDPIKNSDKYNCPKNGKSSTLSELCTQLKNSN